MRVLFAAVGAYGHLIPVLPLALAARDAGHDVSFATDKRFHSALHDAGLDAIAAGITVREAIGAVHAEARGRAVEAAPKAFGDILPRLMAADLGPVLADRKPDLVVYEVLSPGAGIAAALAGIPAVCHGIGRVSGGPTWRAMSDAWTATARELGVDIPATDPQYLGNPYVDICPPSLQLPQFTPPARRLMLRPTVWNQPAALPPIIAGNEPDRPLVYLTFGTAFANPDLLRTAIDGLSRLPVTVLVAAGPIVHDDAIGDVPANVVVERWVPQGAVLPYVDLVVSHGGSGTMLGALTNGLPHLMLPQGADQFGNAAAVTGIGAGRQLLPGDLTSDAVTEQARALLSDDTAQVRAYEVAREIAGMPSAQETVELLTA
jgi:UDP:flavonoid glycosyltransferase YjiC (YdhE family)